MTTTSKRKIEAPTWLHRGVTITFDRRSGEFVVDDYGLCVPSLAAARAKITEWKKFETFKVIDERSGRIGIVYGVLRGYFQIRISKGRFAAPSVLKATPENVAAVRLRIKLRKRFERTKLKFQAAIDALDESVTYTRGDEH